MKKEKKEEEEEEEREEERERRRKKKEEEKRREKKKEEKRKAGGGRFRREERERARKRIEAERKNRLAAMSDVTEGEEKYALDVYTLLRVTQAQHGLKHGDYERYRKYCSRRLLRLYKSLKFVHGKGGKFEKRSLSVEEVKEARYFLIPLMNAERCWSSAMAVKKEIENSKKWVTHRKHHMFKKLKRATTWADEFTSLCSAKGDSRTATEAEAYALFMKGMYLLERGDSNALTAFLQTRSLYEKLGRGGSNEDSATFLELQR